LVLLELGVIFLCGLFGKRKHLINKSQPNFKERQAASASTAGVATGMIAMLAAVTILV